MEKSMVLFMHEQNIICSQTQLKDIAHERTIICRQLFVGHGVSFQPMKRKKNLHQMIILSFLTVGNVKQYEISSFKGQKFLFE